MLLLLAAPGFIIYMQNWRNCRLPVSYGLSAQIMVVHIIVIPLNYLRYSLSKRWLMPA